MENYKLNNFFQNIKLKKQYIDKLNDEAYYLNEIKNKKNNRTIIKNFNIKEVYLVKYIIDIKFSRTNTLVHVMDFSGNLKFYCSGGKVQYTGKRKKSRKAVIRDIYKLLISKLDYLNKQPIALHLKNTNNLAKWLIRLFKKKNFVKVIKIFKTYPSNGCRKKKVRRKKFRTKRRKFNLSKKIKSNLKRRNGRVV